MSFGMVGKLWGCLGISAFLWLAMPALSWAQSCTSCNTCAPACGQSCQMFHCPPYFRHCQEGPPRLCFKCGCPHPVCNPCQLPHWGYFEPCWTPYPFPPDWSHCPTPPPASFVSLNPAPRGGTIVPTLTVPTPYTPPNSHQVLPPASPFSGAGNNGAADLPQPRRIEGNRPGL